MPLSHRVFLTNLSGTSAPADTTAPVPIISCSQTSPSLISPLNFTITFKNGIAGENETVTGFDITKFAVVGGTKSNFAGSGAVYTCNVTPTAAGVTADVAVGVCTDLAGNANLAATQFAIIALNPLFVTGNKLWSDGSDISQLFQDIAGTIPVAADNDPVALLKDKSGLGNYLSQSTDANRVIYKTNIKNGRSVLAQHTADRFGHLLKASPPLTATQLNVDGVTWFVVFYPTGTGANHGEVVGQKSGSHSGNSSTGIDVEAGTFLVRSSGYDGGYKHAKWGASTRNAWQIARSTSNQATGNLEISINGGTAVTQAIGDLTLAPGSLYFMGSGGAAGEWSLESGSYIAESLCYSPALSSNDAAYVLDYLNRKWNVF